MKNVVGIKASFLQILLGLTVLSFFGRLRATGIVLQPFNQFCLLSADRQGAKLQEVLQLCAGHAVEVVGQVVNGWHGVGRAALVLAAGVGVAVGVGVYGCGQVFSGWHGVDRAALVVAAGVGVVVRVLVCTVVC